MVLYFIINCIIHYHAEAYHVFEREREIISRCVFVNLKLHSISGISVCYWLAANMKLALNINELNQISPDDVKVFILTLYIQSLNYSFLVASKEKHEFPLHLID